jgi:T5SS/PEP-CTERM-associated repeat protein
MFPAVLCLLLPRRSSESLPHQGDIESDARTIKQKSFEGTMRVAQAREAKSESSTIEAARLAANIARYSTALTAGLACSLIALSAHATVVTSGSISPGTLTTNPTTTSQIIVGIGSAGSLEVNASAAGNGFTTVTGNFSGSTGLVTGFSTGGVGSVLVNGNGTAGSATVITKSIIVGTSGGNGTLTVQNGGSVQANGAGNIVQAGNSNSTGAITVDGANSSLTSASRIQIGGFAGSSGTMTVSNGAHVTSGTDVGFSDGTVEIGTGDGATGTVSVTSGAVLATNGLIVGSGDVAGTVANSGTLTIQNGGTVTTSGAGTFDGAVSVGSKTGSQITVTGAGSTLQVGALSNFFAGKELLVGGFGQGTLLVDNSGTVNAAGANVMVGGGFSGTNTDPGTLTVKNGGSLTANTVSINQNGTLNGNGTINADVTLNGGTISPGNSPGTLTINGDLSLLNGILNLEIATGVMDLLNVSGNVFFGSDLSLNLIFDDMPAMGALFDIDDFFVGSAVLLFDPAFSLATQLHVSGLADSSFVTVSAGDQTVTFGQPVEQVSEPATLALLGMGLIALGMLRRHRGAEMRQSRNIVYA